MKKIIITYGIIAGLIVSSMLVISFSGSTIDFANGEIFGYAFMIIAFSTIFAGIKVVRDKINNGTITFKNAFLTGLYITLIASVIYVISWMIISNTIASDFSDNYTAYAIEKAQNSGLSAVELEKRIAKIESSAEMYKNPFFKTIITFMEIFPVGLIITLLSAFILKRNIK